MARKTKEQAEATKDAILEAAIKVFVQHGVTKATLEKIALEAGVTRGAVYWHFKNKGDVFAALHEQLCVPFSKMVLEALEKNHPRPLEQLELLCADLLLDLESNARKHDILTIFFLKCEYSGEMEQFLEVQQQEKIKNRKVFSRYFEQAVEKGHLPKDANPHMLANAFTSYITGIAFEYLRSPKAFDLKNEAKPLMRIFFAGAGGSSQS